MVDGDIDQEGRLEVCVNGVLGSICDISFAANTDGHVICSELGYQRILYNHCMDTTVSYLGAVVYYDSLYGDG